ncbi:hypothetical protein M752DRAFT_118729 [Aspergillus phoenicis ATCC 13157]|uniref:Uncharacterized protein n=1 Tax=Aspergillus phoenicis ATCC 13157 TaxID=1353007 RepID=A0A370PT75_ASPPH|nr:hypothetical protein M752DRAFT_118729 [Aspergillus phoenicis ATCC 13157]
MYQPEKYRCFEGLAHKATQRHWPLGRMCYHEVDSRRPLRRSPDPLTPHSRTLTQLATPKYFPSPPCHLVLRKCASRLERNIQLRLPSDWFRAERVCSKCMWVMIFGYYDSLARTHGQARLWHSMWTAPRLLDQRPAFQLQSEKMIRLDREMLSSSCWQHRCLKPTLLR